MRNSGGIMLGPVDVSAAICRLSIDFTHYFLSVLDSENEIAMSDLARHPKNSANNNVNYNKLPVHVHVLGV